MKCIKLYIFFFYIIVSLTNTVNANGLFGPEWTFTNRGLIEEVTNEETIIEEWINHIKKICPECRIKGSRVYFTTDKHTDKWFEINSDPLVLEIQASPLTEKQFKKHKKKLQKLVWDAGELAGVKPHNRLVGGHIHLDIKTHFSGNDLLQRNFIVDLFNHPELFMGAFSLDYLNAPPLATLGRKAIEKVRKALEEFDQRKINMKRLKGRISGVYDGSTHSIRNGSKYQAVNIDHSDTIEIRGFRPQESAQHYLDMITLLEKRIQFLKNIKRPITLNVPNYVNQYTFKTTDTNELHRYRTYVPTQKITRVYKEFIKKTGLNWEKYIPYIANTKLRNSLMNKIVLCRELF